MLRPLLISLLSVAPFALPSFAVAQELVREEKTQQAILVADNLRLEGRDLLIAEGNVEAFYNGQRLQAGRITFDRKENKLTLEGPIVLKEGEDLIILADTGELDPNFENGLMLGARMIMNQRVQLAANQITRVGGRYTHLYKVAATSCRVCDDGTPPIWQIRATRTTHDAEEKQLYFENAQLRVLGVPIFWAPRMRLPDPSLQRATGFLIPSLKQSSQLGFGVKIPYFIRMGDHRDLTLTPYLSQQTATLELRYRQAFHNGNIHFEGATSRDNLQSEPVRSYLFGSGHFDLRNNYKLDFNVESSTDRAYLLEYDYSDKDRLRNNVSISRVEEDSFTFGSLTSYQSLRENEDFVTLPSIVVDARFEKVFEPSVIGGDLTLSFGAHSHHRYSDQDVEGRDVTRADIGLEWQRDFLLPFGIKGSYLAGIEANSFSVAQDSTSDDMASEIIPQTSLELSWPLMKTTANGTQILEPVAMVGWVGGSELSVPNDESTAVEFDEASLLDLSHFPVYDRRERGMRGAVGLNWTRHGNDGSMQAVSLGQVYSENANSSFSNSSGLTGTASDFLIAGQLKSSNGLSLTSRNLFDPEKFDLTKAETRFGWAHSKGSIGGSYVWLGADAAEDRTETISEWMVNGTYNLSRHWSTNFNWRFDAAGSETTFAGLGFQFRNECVEMDLSLSRRFTSSSIVDPSTTMAFIVRLAGFHSGSLNNRHTRSCR